MSEMEDSDLLFIKEAVWFFERPSLLTRSLSVVGDMVESGFTRLPAKVKTMALEASKRAIEQCLQVAVKTISDSDRPAENMGVAANQSRIKSHLHSLATAVTGGVSGFIGPASLVVELPLTTAIMMRSIASTANDFGFSPSRPEVLLECLFVFAIGGPSKNDDGMDSSYLTSKLAFSSLIKKATEAVAGLSAKQALTLIEHGSSPVLMRLVSEVAEVFGIRVSNKLAAQMAPVVGAVGGASINVAFSNFFGSAARFHFGLKRLEERFGVDAVRAVYELELMALKAEPVAKS